MTSLEARFSTRPSFQIQGLKTILPAIGPLAASSEKAACERFERIFCGI